MSPEVKPAHLELTVEFKCLIVSGWDNLMAMMMIKKGFVERCPLGRKTLQNQRLANMRSTDSLVLGQQNVQMFLNWGISFANPKMGLSLKYPLIC